jgi:leucyl-tRNA synthetase
MDTFYDSSWYFLRFCDAMNEDAAFDRGVVDYWMDGGVDLYIGGIEHAVMHLLYARFFTKALRDAGLNAVSEPFSRLVCQGMVNAPTPYCAQCNVESHVDLEGSDCETCGQTLTSRSAKMSKSLGNTVSPDIMVQRFGADTVRLFILFAANPEAGMDWSDTAIESNHRQMKAIHAAFSETPSGGEMDDWLLARMRVNHANWNASMMDVSLREGVMASHFDMLADWQWAQRRGGISKAVRQAFLTAWAPMLYPATPHFAEHWWAALGHDSMLAQSVIGEIDDDAQDGLVLRGAVSSRCGRSCEECSRIGRTPCRWAA